MTSKMLSSKLNTFIENKKFCNILKIIFLLILLLIIYMYFTNNIINNNSINNIYEGFTSAQAYNFYGNVISLKNQLNKPAYSGNQCIFELDDVYRIDTLQFNFNSEINNEIKYEIDQIIYIQYMDGDGNMRYLKSGNRADSPPSIHSETYPTIKGSGTNNNQYYLLIKNITDEHNLPVYTSKIVILIGSNNVSNDNLSLNEYNDAQGYGYISAYGIFGGQRTLLSNKAYDDISKKLIQSTSNNVTTVEDVQHNISTFTFTNINRITNSDMKIYSVMLLIEQTPDITIDKPPSSCFNVNISYNNTLYLSNNFNINTTYKIRSDINKLETGTSSTPSSVFIFFDEPIVANTLIFTINNIFNYKLNITSITINGSLPTPDDIIDFKRNVNTINNDSNSSNTDVCPNINDLLEKQSKTQSICDNLEFQDKVKSEKIRLERNKQYLLKLKDQQEQIDKLNDVIQELENKRASRADITEKAKLLQYQNQKSNISTIRDLANQRLESQDKNKLYMNMNLNYT